MTSLRGLPGLSWAYLLETWRSKPAMFWNLVFPLFTLIVFSYIFGGGEPTIVARGVPGILTINMLAASFFGVSLHMISLREREIYRRIWVTPATSLTVVAAHSLTGLVNIMTSAVLQLAVAKILFHIRIGGAARDLGAALLLGAFAFIPLGLLVGSIAPDMKTGPAISNVLFFPLTFLSGASIPLYAMPSWMQHIAELLPSTYLVEVLQATMLGGRNGLRGVAVPAGILIVTGIAAFAFNGMLFRWESEQPINRRGLLISAAVLSAIYGIAFARNIQLQSAHTPVNARSRLTAPKLRASAQILNGMTLFDGMGGRIDRATVVIEGNRITQVGPAGESSPAGVPVTDLSGLFMIPGLIDSHIHLGGSGGGLTSREEFAPPRVIRDLQVYLALGITSFVSLTDHVEDLQRLQRDVASGLMRAPRPYLSGPGITAPGGHPAQIFDFMPGFANYMTRQVDSPSQAEEAVRELSAMRVDIVKLFLEQGWSGRPLPVLPEPALRSAIRTAHQMGLRTTVHVDNDQHAQLAMDAGADGIEHIPPDLSDTTIIAMVSKGITLTPTLVVYEGLVKSLSGAAATDQFAKQWVDPAVLASLASPESWIAKARQSTTQMEYFKQAYQQRRSALRRAVAANVAILAGSDAGNPGSFHGLGLIRELELLVEAGGMSPQAAISAATGSAAKRLGRKDVGRIAPGAFADFVVLDADPSKDIRAIRAVRTIYFGGVPLERVTLLSTSPGNWRPLFSFPSNLQPPAR
jgi:imidazolonepropionase-like amidohydrolase/ABC-type multidrug transport system permease subunit